MKRYAVLGGQQNFVSKRDSAGCQTDARQILVHLASVLLAAGPPQSWEELRGNDVVREP